MDKTIVSRRLLSTIEEKGMSYGEVAKLTGIPKSAVHRYSTGETVKIPIDRIESMASVLGVSAAYLMGWDNATNTPPQNSEYPHLIHERSNARILKESKLRMIPHFQSVSAGCGIRAESEVINYMPLYIESDIEAMDTMCIDVCGDSMYPKIENGDTIVVRKQSSVDSGSIAVVLVDGEDALVKRVVYDDENIELQSINPEYAPKIFRGADVLRVEVIGLVRKIIKNL